MEMASQCLSPLFSSTPCSCVILAHTYYLYHYFAVFRQIFAAGIRSEMENWGCHQPGLKLFCFARLCEIGEWAQFSCWMCPHYKLFGFVFPILCRPAAGCCLSPQLVSRWGFSVSSSHQVFRSAWSWAWRFRQVLNFVSLAGSNVSHIFFPCRTSHRGQ